MIICAFNLTFNHHKFPQQKNTLVYHTFLYIMATLQFPFLWKKRYKNK